MLLCLLAFSLPLAAIEIRTDFEGGNLGRIEKVSDSHYRLGSKGETDQDRRNRQANWYYFRVERAPKTELIFDIVDLPGEYNYQPNRGAITGDTPPVISYDGKNWTHVTTFEYDSGEPKLRLRIKPRTSPTGPEVLRREMRHRGIIRTHLLPQQHKHRFASYRMQRYPRRRKRR